MIKNQKGFILIAVYLVITVLVILGAAFVSRSLSEMRIAERAKNSMQAFYLGEAGIDQAIWEVNSGGGAWSGWNTSGNPYTSGTRALATGDFSVSVTDPTGNNPIIQAIGYSPGIAAANVSARAVRVKLERGSSPLFTHALFSQNEIELFGSATVDSYNSANGPYGPLNRLTNGDVGTNGTTTAVIDLTGSIIINGDVSTGTGGTIDKTGSIVVNGNETHDNNANLSPVTVSSDLTSLTSSGELELSGSNTQTLSSGDYKFSEIDLSGSSTLTLQGPMRIYITGEEDSIKSTGSSRITTTGEVEIYVDGDVKISGSGIINQSGTPSNFILYGTQTSDEIEWSGSSSLYGAVYAPGAEIDISGSAVVYGSVVGETIELFGSAVFHYDEALQSAGPSGGTGSSYVILNWQEQ